MIVVPVEKGIDWKRPPIVLIALVIINLLVFAFYQMDDDILANNAFEAYYDRNLVDLEWQAFEAFAHNQKLPIELDKENVELQYYMSTSANFGQFVKDNQRFYINKKHIKKWQLARQEVEIFSSQISSNEMGFNPSKISVIQLFSYQFLHGGIMHLLGNMVFLILTGFAVEAAIGSLRFLAFYLLAGIGSALFFALFSSPYSSSLVGASGSISGVMAMYVVLFQARKIQFFYWFFIFTGYFKAAAIIMLPFYVAFEVYKFMTDIGSNVAYTAHIGGFIVGATLVYLTQSINNSAIDDNYLSGIEEVDEFSLKLQKVYNYIGQCNFQQAWNLLKKLKTEHPEKHILTEIEFNLILALHPKKSGDYLIHRMDKIGNSKPIIDAQIRFWNKQSDEKKQSIGFHKKNLLLQNCLRVDEFSCAESIFNSIKVGTNKNIEKAVMARHLATYSQSNNKPEDAQRFDLLSKEFTVLDKKEGNAFLEVS